MTPVLLVPSSHYPTLVPDIPLSLWEYLSIRPSHPEPHVHIRAFWASELLAPYSLLGFGLVLRKPEVGGGEEQRE